MAMCINYFNTTQKFNEYGISLEIEGRSQQIYLVKSQKNMICKQAFE